MGASPKEHGYIAVVCGNDAETRLEAGYIDEIQGVLFRSVEDIRQGLRKYPEIGFNSETGELV